MGTPCRPRVPRMPRRPLVTGAVSIVRSSGVALVPGRVRGAMREGAVPCLVQLGLMPPSGSQQSRIGRGGGGLASPQ